MNNKKNQYQILYEDNDEEELSEKEIMKILDDNQILDTEKKSNDENKSASQIKANEEKNKVQEQQVNKYPVKEKVEIVKTEQQVSKTPIKKIENPIINSANVNVTNTVNVNVTMPQGKSKRISNRRPSIFELLESATTSKYLPCGYDKDGKVIKVLRVQ